MNGAERQRKIWRGRSRRMSVNYKRDGSFLSTTTLNPSVPKVMNWADLMADKKA